MSKRAVHIDFVPDDAELKRLTSALTEKLSHAIHPGECKRITDNNGLPYVAWHEHSEKLMKAKQRQLVCETCSLFRWDYERCALFTPSMIRSDSK